MQNFTSLHHLYSISVQSLIKYSHMTLFIAPLVTDFKVKFNLISWYCFHILYKIWPKYCICIPHYFWSIFMQSQSWPNSSNSLVQVSLRCLISHQSQCIWLLEQSPATSRPDTHTNILKVATGQWIHVIPISRHYSTPKCEKPATYQDPAVVSVVQ